MRRSVTGVFLLPLMMLVLTGSQSIGEKTSNLTVIYAVTAILSLLALITYCCVAKKKDPWFLLLFACVLIVNVGYLALAISRNLEEALLANRVAYLGSVFLPLSMLMIILDVSTMRPGKWLSGALIALGVLVFLIAASPGYLDIYYKEVYFKKINGVTVLDKVYGPLHGLYLVYLLGYFAAMVTVIVHATVKDKIESLAYAAILAIAVFVNIGVWLIEQLVRIDFEVLSVSYIISESFLLGLHLFMAETEKGKQVPAPPPEPAEPVQTVEPERLAQFARGLQELTPKEREIYDCYVAGLNTAEIMEKLSIKENTLKFHNKNLYGKLGVGSRKQLLELYRSQNK